MLGLEKGSIFPAFSSKKVENCSTPSTLNHRILTTKTTSRNQLEHLFHSPIDLQTMIRTKCNMSWGKVFSTWRTSIIQKVNNCTLLRERKNSFFKKNKKTNNISERKSSRLTCIDLQNVRFLFFPFLLSLPILQPFPHSTTQIYLLRFTFPDTQDSGFFHYLFFLK